MTYTKLPSSQSRFDPEYPLLCTEPNVAQGENSPPTLLPTVALKALRGHDPEFVDGAVRVPLTKGQFALVDLGDLERVGAWRWSATLNSGQWYAVRSEAGKRVYMHRQIIGAHSDDVIDHINRCPLDNRRSNIRVVDYRGNAANRAKPYNTTTSPYIGIRLERSGSWTATYRKNGVQTCVGTFRCPVDAAKARDAAVLAEYGEIARLNFPTVAA